MDTHPTSWLKGPSKGAATEWQEPCVRIGYPLDSRWQIQMDLVPREGRMVVSSLTLHVPFPSSRHHDDPGEMSEDQCARMKRALPPQGLTSRDVRKLSSPAAVADRLHEAWQAFETDYGISLYEGLPEVPHLPAPARQQGRGLTDGELAATAEMYLSALRDLPPGQRSVLERMREMYAEEGVEVSTRLLNGRVKKCRRGEQWLTAPGKRGVVGAKAGPELLKWRAAQRRRTKRAQSKQKPKGRGGKR